MKRIPMLRSFWVFNVAQCDLPEGAFGLGDALRRDRLNLGTVLIARPELMAHKAGDLVGGPFEL